MAYFLKQSKQGKHTYISIYESFYNPEKKQTSHKCFKSLGSIESLIAKGISDPIQHYRNEVDKLNAQREKISTLKISDSTVPKNLGYFPFHFLLKKLKIELITNLFRLNEDFQYNPFEILSSLIYARAVKPCSKIRTFNEIIPCLYQKTNFTYNQMLSALEFFGQNYEKFVEMFTVQSNKYYGIDVKSTYFDCTNFYFEIDKEDDLRRKGPSKEHRPEPIVSLGLLLDHNQIPIGMKIFPGNQSEKPYLHEVASDLKHKYKITGKTIYIADKGLNCAENIVKSLKNEDGYLFSKSIKGLSEKEKLWILMKEGWKDFKDNEGNVVYSYKSCIDKFPYTVEFEGKKVTIELKEKRLVTYNKKLAEKQISEIHKLIEKAINLSAYSNKKNEYGESAKYISFIDSDGKPASTKLNQTAIDKDIEYAGLNMLVTSEIKMTESEMYNAYHNLWRIEESFRIMKTDLEARPVFLQKEHSIKGHFLICYLTVLLERLFELKILSDKYPSSQIFEMVRKFNVIKGPSKFINISRNSALLQFLEKNYSIPLTNLYLSESQIDRIFNKDLIPIKL